MSISGINSTQPIRFNEKQKEKANYAGNAILGSWTAAGAAFGITNLTLNPIINETTKLHKLSSDELKLSKEAIAKTFKESGLEAKGVKIANLSQENTEAVDTFINDMTAALHKKMKKFKKTLPQDFDTKVKEKLQNNPGIKSIIAGDNAAYYRSVNQIAINENKRSLSFFHEMGHALNRNSSKIGKYIQPLHNLRLLAPAVLLFSTFTRTKEETNDNKLTTGQKVTNFIRKHAGALTLAAFAPLLVEEGMASYKGNKLAKKALDKNLYGKVKSVNAKGFSTYVIVALASAIAAKAGVYVVDKLHENHQHKS